MADMHVDMVNGSDYYDGSTFTAATKAKYLFVFAGSAAGSPTVTPPSDIGGVSFVERLDSVDADTGFVSYFADLTSYNNTSTGTISATLSGSTAVKGALALNLIPAGLTPIAFVNSSLIGEADNSVDASAPADIANNDIMLALVTATGASYATITPPAGWTLIGTLTGSATRFALYWKRCASESGTYTFSHDGSTSPKTQVAIVAYRGCITTGSPIDQFSATGYVTTNTTLRAAEITATAVAGPKRSLIQTISPGEVAKIAKSPETYLGDTTWTHKSTALTLPTADLTKMISDCDTAWTAVTGTAVTSTNYLKQGTNTARFQAASAFTTGLMAYQTLAAPLDLSGYTKISFWLATSGDLAANTIQIALCSDTAGATPVDTFTVDYTHESTAGSVCLTFNKGAALGSAIQSIALYALIDPSTYYIYLDNIIACNDFSLNSIVGKNSAGEGWYALKSITDTAVVLDGKGYYGASGEDSLYMINPWCPYWPTTSSSTNLNTVSGMSGSTDSPITFRGGYNTSTGEVDGVTFIDGRNGYGYAFRLDNASWVTYENLGAVRYYDGFNGSTSTYNTRFKNVYAISNGHYGMYMAGGGPKIIEDSFFGNNINHGIYIPYIKTILKNTKVVCNFDSGLRVDADSICTDVISGYNTNGIEVVTNTIAIGNKSFYNCVLKDNTLYDVAAMSDGEVLRGKGTDFGDIDFSARQFTIISIDDVQFGGHKIYAQYYNITSETTTMHSVSGLAWKFSPTNYFYVCEINPAKLNVATIAANADETVTVSIWVYRSNTGINAKLFCLGSQLDGITDDIYSYAVGDAETWEQISIEVTPTETGTFNVEMQVWGGDAYSVIVDDVTIERS